MTNRHAILLALTLLGCPKSGFDPDSPTDTFKEGVRLLEVKSGSVDYQKAYEMFEKSILLDGAPAKAHYNAGWTAVRLGRLDDAERHYQTAVERDPNYGTAIRNLGEVLTANGNGAKAVSLYSQYLQSNPHDPQIQNNYIEALTASGQYDQAIEEIRKLLRKDKKNVNAYRNLSRIYFAQKRYEMSQLCADKAKDLGGGSDSSIYNNIGVTFLVMEDQQKAILEFKNALDRDSTNVPANMNLGYVAIASGDYKLGQLTFDRALKAEPGNLDAKLGMAVALRGLKDYKGAGKLYDEIISADPKNQNAYFNAATLHARYTKNYSKAEQYLDAFSLAYKNQLQGDMINKIKVRKARIQDSKDAEAAKKREAERRKKDAEERKARQKDAFGALKVEVTKLESIMTKYGDCPFMIESGGTEQGKMYLEQAKMVIEAEEVDMAPDIMDMLQMLMPQLEPNVKACQSVAPAPPAPPQEGGQPPAPPQEGGQPPAPPQEGGQPPPPPQEGGQPPAPPQEGGQPPAPPQEGGQPPPPPKDGGQNPTP
jgi:tetratricopeptide (TPR) repeat protein